MNTKISLSLADELDRETIYAMRHQVYARELGQHLENPAERLTDILDAINVYLVAKVAGEIAGFVAITPPNTIGYSIDKYFAREDLPLVFDEGLFEARLLTVAQSWRSSRIAALLMYGALRYIESCGGRTVVGIGRLEVLDLYKHAGFRTLQKQVRSGRVTFELITVDLKAGRPELQKMITDLEKHVAWDLEGIGFYRNQIAYHGGAFFDAIGDEFKDLQKKDTVISADVLDAWFDPAPNVISKLTSNLSWALRTSPPTHSEGLRRVIAQSRGVHETNILPGAGSSDLIFLGLRQWLKPEARVLILDPMYGEYAHVLEKIIGCQVERFTLSREHDYRIEPQHIMDGLKNNYDWVILVNPNSPTGQHMDRETLQEVIRSAPASTHFWIDETYIDYVGSDQSLERFAAKSANTIVCKSMSKVYALSGARCAYVCGPSSLMDELRPFSPPWAVSLPSQMAACEALRNLDYYQAKWIETHRLREELAQGLQELGWEVLPGCANFLLCHLPPDQPEAMEFVKACRKRDLFIRDVASMGKCFDKHTVRIAVKDQRTNFSMLQILGEILREKFVETIQESRVLQ
jgi:histidinol-phosphate/aromatic aminotransferase/cobyric acid decarboxylase-like protein